MKELSAEFWYRIQRYEWAKRAGKLDEEYPIIGYITTKCTNPMDNKNNSGNCNSWDYNSGYRNSGYRNSGDYNSGNCNSGNCNSGYWNSGYRNSGYRNSGDYNSGNCNSGWFNTNEPKMRFFNKESDLTYSDFVKGRMVYPDLKICAWVGKEDMTDEEKKLTDGWEQTGGYLKTLSYKDAWKEYWGRASAEDKEWFKSLPNFDPAIFEEITGINVAAVKDEIVVDGVTYRRVK